MTVTEIITTLITTYLPIGMTIVGVLAFITSVITEVIKESTVFKRIPTDLVVICISILITLFTLFSYATYAKFVVSWYLTVGAVIVGFFVAFVATFGWEKLTTLYARFRQ